MSTILDFGIWLVQVLQSGSPAFDGLMEIFSFMGTIDFYLLLVPLVYWLVDARLGLRIFLVLIGTDFLGSAFKQLLRQPRPYWVGDVKALATETSYGIPSTHASDSLAVWGYMAYRLKKDWLWSLSAILVSGIGLSRLYLGVHFPQDILGGWLIGLFFIFLFLKAERLFTPRWKTISTPGQIGLGFALSILIILGGLFVVYWISHFADPVDWSSYSTNAREIFKYFTLAGSLCGAVSGYVLMRRYASYQTSGAWWQKAGRYLLGIAGVIVLYVSLDLLFGLLAADASPLGYLLRYIRYAAVTFWATFGAPWIFRKLKLAEAAIEGREAPAVGASQPLPVVRL